jgi:hypothetical protein
VSNKYCDEYTEAMERIALEASALFEDALSVIDLKRVALCRPQELARKIESYLHDYHKIRNDFSSD